LKKLEVDSFFSGRNCQYSDVKNWFYITKHYDIILFTHFVVSITSLSVETYSCIFVCRKTATLLMQSINIFSFPII